MQLTDKYGDQLLNLAMDTINKDKQALVFCNTKRGAESQAEKISKKTQLHIDQLNYFEELSEQILKAVSSPTKQCRRLASCVKKGVAFHHSGLNSKQRELIEDNFRNNKLFIICSTPTLAAGLDLPAFRAIVKDTKRFSVGKGWGMTNIPVLEYEQMCGRAGRPGKEDFGEAILIANNEDEAEKLSELYIEGKPEDIYSKLAVEPVLRTYLLSLISTGFIKDYESMFDFFDNTFYAAQYGDLRKLHDILNKMLKLLEEWEFIIINGKSNVIEKDSLFQDANEIIEPIKDNGETFRATPLGTRVAQLYLDPYTAAFLIKHLKKATSKKYSLNNFALLHLLSSTIELRPLLKPKQKDYDLIDEKLIEEEGSLLVPEPNNFSYDYEDFLAAIKTAMFFEDWIEESTEDQLFEKYAIRPGEIQAKKERADWLLYSCEELCKILAFQSFLTPLAKMRVRLEYGVKEDLLNLLRFKNIGKVRARTLYRNGIKSVGDIKSTEYTTLVKLIGPKNAANLKEQVGEKVRPEQIKVKPNKRKGQKSLGDFGY